MTTPDQLGLFDFESPEPLCDTRSAETPQPVVLEGENVSVAPIESAPLSASERRQYASLMEYVAGIR